jgi:phosphatidylserine decarboxylase
MRSALLVWAQVLLPQRLLGHCIHRLARSTRAFVRKPLIHWFARTYRVDLAEAERRDLDDYASFNDFFTRALRADARPVAGGDATLISPADGLVTEFGTARDGKAIQAKGMPYALAELVGPAPGSASSVRLGDFVTIYLAPHDYHRVHLPLAGRLRATRFVPGKRFAVNRRTAQLIPALFVKNQRVVCWFDTAAGPMAVVLVGALNVSSIAMAWLGDIPSGGARVWEPAGEAREFRRGEEIGRFNLGSTVIAVLPAGSVSWLTELEAGQPIRTGAALGALRGPGDRA